MKKQAGFTLIELVVVIVILGILSATAMPKFMDLSKEAGDASAQGVAGALASASATNYAKRMVNSANGTDIKSGVATCASLDALLTPAGLPTDLAWVAAGTVITCTDGSSSACTLKHNKGTTGNSYAVTAMCTS